MPENSEDPYSSLRFKNIREFAQLIKKLHLVTDPTNPDDHKMTTDLEFHNLSGMPKLDHPEGKYSIYCVDFSIDRNELMPEEIFARAVAGYNVQSNIIGKPIAYLVENSMRKSIESIVNGASVTLERGETMITVSYEYCTKLKPTQ